MRNTLQSAPSVESILRRLAELKITISIKNGEILLKGKLSAISPKCREVIKNAKPSLLAHFEKRSQENEISGSPTMNAKETRPASASSTDEEPVPIAKDDSHSREELENFIHELQKEIPEFADAKINIRKVSDPPKSIQKNYHL